MRPHHYLLAAAVLMGGSMATPAATTQQAPDFATTAQTAATPSQLKAEKALSAFAAHVADNEQSGRRHTLERHAGSSDDSLPAGFPLAIDDAGQLDDLEIGWGFAVYDVPPRRLFHSDELGQNARRNGQWRYAVTLHGKPVGMITMAHTANGWQAVSFGGAELSREVGRTVSRYADQPGTRLRYVRVPQATSGFVEVMRDTANPSYVPLQAAREKLHLNSAKRLSAAQLLPRLRETVKNSLSIRP